MRPKRSTAAAAARSTAAASDTSVASASASAPSAAHSLAAVRSAASPRASSTSRAPSRAKARAAARPTPLEAPVITTTADLLSGLTGALLDRPGNVVRRERVLSERAPAGGVRPPARCPSRGSRASWRAGGAAESGGPAPAARTCWAARGAGGVHRRLLGRAPALAQVAGGAGGDDVLPARPPAAGAGRHVVEGEVLRRAAVLAGEGVAQEEVEAGEGGRAVLRDVALQRHHAGHRHLERRRTHHVVVGRDHAHAVEEHRLDHLLPRPQGQRIIRQRPIVGVEHERRPAGRRAGEHLQRHADPPRLQRAPKFKEASALTKTGLLPRGSQTHARRPADPASLLKIPRRENDGADSAARQPADQALRTATEAAASTPWTPAASPSRDRLSSNER